MAKKKRWVVKAGSKMVCEGGPLLLRSWMQQVEQLRRLHNVEIVWVTSGAIAWASERISSIKKSLSVKSRKDRTLPESQALSAIGQPLIMDQYGLALQSVGLLGAQVLLTASDIKNKERRSNLKNTLEELLKMHVTPVLNENDAVATEEIQFGDNDTLASLVAEMLKADKLILLTDVDGLFNKNPVVHKNAQLISYVKKITKKELKMAPKSGVSRIGKGGMYSKLNAANSCAKHGVVTHFIRGDASHNLLCIAKSLPIGTQIGGNSPIRTQKISRRKKK